MTSSSDSESDEETIFLGTPMPIEEEERPGILAKSSRNQVPSIFEDRVLDERGRAKRLHGAFTGGFSAGYFNTVGSKEGFTPSTFVSSRKGRTKERSSVRKPEDFMDEEDFSEFGIAPRTVKTAHKFDDREVRSQLTMSLGSSTIPQANMLADLIVPKSMPISEKLMRKMGWREGGVVGAQKQKEKRCVSQVGASSPVSVESDDETGSKKSPAAATSEAPSYTLLNFEPKKNTFGLGYSGLSMSSVLPSGPSRSQELVPKGRAVRAGIRGQAFGVGAQASEVKDIYATDSMQDYDWSIGDGDADEANASPNKIHGWTAPSNKTVKQSVPSSYVGDLLTGFTLQVGPSSTLTRKVFLPVNKLPRFYVPVFSHKCIDPSAVDEEPKEQVTCQEKPPPSTVAGFSSKIESVFDLLRPEDRNRLQQKQQPSNLSPSIPPSPCDFSLESTAISSATKSGSILLDTRTPTTSISSSTSRWDRSASNTSTPVPVTDILSPAAIATNAPTSSLIQRSTTASSTSSGTSQLFQPFKHQPDKQARFDEFTRLQRQGLKDPYSELSKQATKCGTEWEQQRECEEFSRAVALFRPLSRGLASKFQSAGSEAPLGAGTAGGVCVIQDIQEQVKRNEAACPVEKSDRDKAIELGLYGPVTRDVVAWHPDNLLCKRFNVPNPYPGSSLVGTQQEKSIDSFSSLDFLSPASSTKGSSHLATIPGENGAEKPKTLSEIAATGPSKKSIFSVLFEEPPPSPPSQLEKPDVPVIAVAAKPPSLHSQLKENSSNIGMIVDNSQSNEPPALPPRPPVDLFKAIFASSDEDSDDSSSIEESIVPKPAIGPQRGPTSDQTEPAFKPSSLFSHLFVQDGPLAAQENPKDTDNTSPTSASSAEKLKSSQKAETPITLNNTEDRYGPALPPVLVITSGISSEDRKIAKKSRGEIEEDYIEVTKENYSNSKKKSKLKRLKKKAKKEKKNKKKSKKKKRKYSKNNSDSESKSSLSS